MRWACGLTTVPERRHTTLGPTLDSLYHGGFSGLRLFVDGATDDNDWARTGLYPTTFHYPRVHAYGNFYLGLLELYLRDPTADLFAMFQDDVLVCRNLRPYLETLTIAGGDYLNLMSTWINWNLCPVDLATGKRKVGLHRGNQWGHGAQGLVFPRRSVQNLLQSHHWVYRPLAEKNEEFHPERAWCNLDGGVVCGIKELHGLEVCHNPPLLQHRDCPTTLPPRRSQKGNQAGYQPRAPHWVGEDFDALSLAGVAVNMVVRTAEEMAEAARGAASVSEG
jgi:hypothetical protein